MSWKKLDLEISLKPFYDLSDEGMTKVARQIFSQWRNLIERAESVSMMFWAADGSEILEYNGKMTDTFDWAKWVGVANPHGENTDLPPERKRIHELPRLYMTNPPDYTYGDFKRLLDILKATFREMFGRELRLGATFDSGPEFAKSDFKYHRHPEICRGFCLGGKTFVCCYTRLHADTHSYATYPNGIPEDTSFGTFLGKQSQRYLTDMGFDYIWFSNGFGFGMETWGDCGAIFDGIEFTPSRSIEVKNAMFDFWHDFRRECPKFPIETRGTNLSTGMDLTSDATPLREIYQTVSDIEVPPNSPWAALNGNFGLELAGWMSHIAELPKGKKFPFRFYIHDPWFINSPWLDRYGRMPHDIYLPLSIARVNGEGKLDKPETLHMLTLDDSYGRMPDQVPEEVIPYLHDAERTMADAFGPLLWLYPFDEYHDNVYAGERMEEIFAGDQLICSALNSGFPLNGIVSGGNFLKAIDNGADFTGRVLVVPTIFTVKAKIMQTLKKLDGVKIMFYGPARGDIIEKWLELDDVPGLSGDFTIDGPATSKEPTHRVRHLDTYSGGAIDRQLKAGTKAKVLAQYVQNGQTRPALVSYGKDLVWIRGTNSFTMEKNGGIRRFDRDEYFYCEKFFRIGLKEFGYDIEFEKFNYHQQEPRLTLRMFDNAIYMAEFCEDMTLRQWMRFPDGAPAFTGVEMYLKHGKALYNTQKAVNAECRVFVSGDDGVVKVKEEISLMLGVARRISVQGLTNGRVVFRPETGRTHKITFRKGAGDPVSKTLLEPNEFEVEHTCDGFGEKYIVNNVNETMIISWGE